MEVSLIAKHKLLFTVTIFCFWNNSRKIFLFSLADDVITPEKVTFLKKYVEESILKFSKLLRAPKRKSNIIFPKSTGSYTAYYAANGYPNALDIMCMADCAKGINLYIPDSYCSEGIDADVVLFVNIMIPEPMVGGSGTYCSSESSGRTTGLARFRIFFFITTFVT